MLTFESISSLINALNPADGIPPAQAGPMRIDYEAIAFGYTLLLQEGIDTILQVIDKPPVDHGHGGLFQSQGDN